MAQRVGTSPKIEVEWSYPDGFKLVRWENGRPIGTAPRFLPETKTPIVDGKGKQKFRKDNQGRKGGSRHTYINPIQEVLVIGRKTDRGHVRWERFEERSAEELAAEQRRAKLAAFRSEFDELAVDAGLTPAQVIEGLAGKPVKQRAVKPKPAPAPVIEDDDTATAPEPVKEVSYPLHLQFGRFLLSNGEEIQGKQAALDAEHALTGEPPPK